MLNKLTRDHGSFWAVLIKQYRIKCLRSRSTFFARVKARINGVILAKGCSFYGIPHFDRIPFSEIVIGENCTFRSDQTSNLIGVNHKCVLSTHDKDARIKIGSNCGFSGVTIGAAKEISIGNHVLCGANVVITDFDWHLDISNTQPEPVIIHDNVWIGLNSVVLKGVEIGANSIIGANSLVTMNIPENVIAGGNPCKVLKSR